MGAVAQYEKSMIVQKLAASRQRKRDRGERCEGKKPYGYFEGEQKALDIIKRLRRMQRGKRLSYGKIAAELTAADCPTRTGTTWHRNTVMQIVKANWPSMA